MDNNIDNIINYENSFLLKSAEDKFLFLAFCIEMKRFNSFLIQDSIHEFKTYLPIQLDGTCNGFQHLALLSNETEIFRKLNLQESTKDQDPEDFYSHVVDILSVHLEYKMKNHLLEIDRLELLYLEGEKIQNPPLTEEEEESKDSLERIRVKLNNLKDELKSIERLSKISLTRSNIKTAIMTKPYNAKDKTLVKYVQDTLAYVKSESITIKGSDGLDVPRNISWYKINDSNNDNLINYNDVELLVRCMNEILYIQYPKLKILSDYLKDIAKLHNKLNLPII